MKKAIRVLIIIVATLLVIAGIGIIGINLYIQSTGMQSKIQGELSESLHMPLKLSNTSFIPWKGLKLTGITIPTDNAKTKNFLQVSEVTAHFRVWPLFKRRLIIKEITIREPKISWIQNPDGKWILPQLTAESIPELPSQEIPDSPDASMTSTSDIPQDVPMQKHEPQFQVQVDNFRIKNGTINFLDQDLNPVGSFLDVNMRCPVATEEMMEGKITSSKASIRERFFLEKLKSTFVYSGGDLSLPDLNANVSGGRIFGKFKMNNIESRSDLEIKFQEVDLSRLIKDTGGSIIQASGSLNGFLILQGDLKKSESINGNGQIILLNGQIRQYEFLQQLGRALQIEELAQLNLQQAQTDYRVAEKKVFIDQLLLESTNLKLVAYGEIKSDQKLALSARLTVNQKIHRQLPDFIEGNLTPIENTDLRYIDFDIMGTLDDPKTNLMNKMLGKKIETDVVDLFKNILGKKEKKKKKKKKEKLEIKESDPTSEIPPEAAPTPESFSSPTPIPEPELTE